MLDLRATGTVIKFDGFLTLYQEGEDDEQEDEEGKRLPAMSAGEPLAKRAIAATQHFTEPPPRYSEASLVKRMEELGIGRPSTYASILQVLKDRNYVRLEKKRLYAEDKGRVVVAFLENFFARYVEYEFTAGLEEDLDRIANSEVDWRAVLRDFWRDFIGAVDDIKDLRVSEVLDVLDAMLAPHLFPPSKDGTDPRQCPTCGNGRLSLKLGKFGAFIGCSNYPECRFTRQLAANGANGADANKVLGKDPETGLDVALQVRPVRAVSAARRRLQGREAEARRHPEGLVARRHHARDCAEAALAAARGRQAPGERRADPGRHRPLRSLRAAPEDLRQSRLRRGRAHHRPQPRRHADCRKARKPRKRPPIRRRSRAVRWATIRSAAGRSW